MNRSRSEGNDTYNNHSGLFACFKRNKEGNTQHFKSSFCGSQAQLFCFSWRTTGPRFSVEKKLVKAKPRKQCFHFGETQVWGEDYHKMNNNYVGGVHAAHDKHCCCGRDLPSLLLFVSAASWGFDVSPRSALITLNGRVNIRAPSLTQTLTGTKKDLNKENINHQWKSGAKFKVSSWI